MFHHSLLSLLPHNVHAYTGPTGAFNAMTPNPSSSSSSSAYGNKVAAACVTGVPAQKRPLEPSKPNNGTVSGRATGNKKPKVTPAPVGKTGSILNFFTKK
jgi:hypothetical protein